MILDLEIGNMTIRYFMKENSQGTRIKAGKSNGDEVAA